MHFQDITIFTVIRMYGVLCYSKLRSLVRRVIPASISKGKLLLGSTAMLAVSVCAYGAYSVFYSPTVALNFAQTQTCADKLTIAPSLFAVTESASHNIELANKWSVGGVALVSRQVCVTPAHAQAEQTIEPVKYAPLGIAALAQSVDVAADQYPKLAESEMPQGPISVTSPLLIKLESADAIFSYTLTANESSVACESLGNSIQCPVDALKLAQGQEYSLSLQRYFDQEFVETAMQLTLKTANAILITDSSVQKDSEVKEPLGSIVLTSSEPLLDQGTVALRSGELEVPSTLTIADNSITIGFTEPLPWDSAFELRLFGLQSTSGGSLAEDYTMKFTTAGGPSVTGVNIGSSSVDVSTALQVYFDQELGSLQNNKIVLLNGDKPVASVLSKRGSTLYINPSGSLARCASYRVTLAAGSVEKKHSVKNEQEYHKSFRTRCAEISTIGRSVRGRAITSYSFGSGKTILLIGAMHGTEPSSKRTLDSMVDDLENNPQKIPKGRRVVIVPNINPDGVARAQRTNANDVDLNRNFPTSDWQQETYAARGVTYPNGGGSKPLSEPESRALADLINRLSPSVVFTYHAVGSVVLPNGSGNSRSLASLYASGVGYRVISGGETDDTFSYTTTGELEDWLREKKGIATVLIELGARYNSVYRSHSATIQKVLESY